MDELITQSNITPSDYKTLYPLFTFDVRKQTEKLESSIVDIAILDEPILDDNTPVLQPTPTFIAKSMQKIKDFGNWLLDYIPPKSKVVYEAHESFKILIKKLYNKRDTSFQLKE